MRKMSTKVVDKIVRHFVDIYEDEIDDVDADCINEWWGLTIDQYADELESEGLNLDSDEGKEDVYVQIEKAIFKEIKDNK